MKLAGAAAVGYGVANARNNRPAPNGTVNGTMDGRDPRNRG